MENFAFGESCSLSEAIRIESLEQISGCHNLLEFCLLLHMVI